MHFLPQTNYLSCQNSPSQKDGSPHGQATSEVFWGKLPNIKRLHTEPNTCKKMEKHFPINRNGFAKSY